MCYDDRMIRLALCTLLFLSACKKDEAAPAPKPAAPTTVAKDGPRRIAIEANTKGYTPDKISGKPGEKLTLVFTRTADSECISQVKVPPKGSKPVDLPMNQPVEVAVTVPTTGEVTFTCGMDMFTGSIVADPAT
jgi:plastocyanin domain-containing protein